MRLTPQAKHLGLYCRVLFVRLLPGFEGIIDPVLFFQFYLRLPYGIVACLFFRISKQRDKGLVQVGPGRAREVVVTLFFAYSMLP